MLPAVSWSCNNRLYIMSLPGLTDSNALLGRCIFLLWKHRHLPTYAFSGWVWGQQSYRCHCRTTTKLYVARLQTVDPTISILLDGIFLL
jgi:hypothetical protein